MKNNAHIIKVGIVGISGYSGGVALELLLNHPGVRVTYVSANNTTGNIADIWPQMKTRTPLVCHKFNVKAAAQSCELIFLAVPHTVSMAITPALLKAGLKVIDLSGDYRLKKSLVYEKWYAKKHTDPVNLKKTVYGLPELFREKIKKASLVANPGCYPTAAILALTPFVSIYPEAIDSIIIDAKSGVSGAGRKAHLALSYSEVNENFKAYKVLKHQHTPEIDLYLTKLRQKKISVDFVPHLLPVTRGILETIYIRTNKKISLNKLIQVYKRFYKTEPFVRVLEAGQQPELKHVTQTNFCDIGLAARDNQLFVITSAIDNLLKGAAGQAVQNMNIMNGFDEKAGLL